MPVKDVVAAGKRVGLAITPSDVYATRSSARRRFPVATRAAAHALGAKPRAATAEDELRRLMLRAGLVRAREVLAALEEGL